VVSRRKPLQIVALLQNGQPGDFGRTSARAFLARLVNDSERDYAVPRLADTLETEDDNMKRLAWFAAALLLIPAAVRAQEQTAQPVANPVSTNIKQQLARYSKIMVAAADAMPAEKFNYYPTPQQMTFAHLTAHIATSNTFLCSKISGTPAPDLKLADTDPKDQLVAGLKASFDYCTTALAAVDDSKLGQPITLFGNRPNTMAGAMISITNDWADHYSTQASYLRLNGILPPTAQPAPAK